MEFFKFEFTGEFEYNKKDKEFSFEINGDRVALDAKMAIVFADFVAQVFTDKAFLVTRNILDVHFDEMFRK